MAQWPVSSRRFPLIHVPGRFPEHVQSAIGNRQSAAAVARICLATLLFAAIASARERRKVIIDQDCSGPGGSNMQAVATLVQSPEAETLGVAVVTGDAWRDEELVHALRLLEIIGRPDIPVLPGAVFPLVNSREETQEWEKLYGKISYREPGMRAGGTSPSWCHQRQRACLP
jgi:hypothetical protein